MPAQRDQDRPGLQQQLLDFGWIDRQLDALPLQERERLCLRALVHLAGDRRRCVASRQQIAQAMLGSSVERADKALRTLVSLGFIARHPRPGQAWLCVVNWGAILEPEDFAQRWEPTLPPPSPHSAGTPRVGGGSPQGAELESGLLGEVRRLLAEVGELLRTLPQLVSGMVETLLRPVSGGVRLQAPGTVPAPVAAVSPGYPQGTPRVTHDMNEKMNECMHELFSSGEENGKAGDNAGWQLNIERGELLTADGVETVFSRYQAAGVLQPGDREDWRAFVRCVLRRKRGHLEANEEPVRSVEAFVRSTVTGTRWRQQIKARDRQTVPPRGGNVTTETEPRERAKPLSAEQVAEFRRQLQERGVRRVNFGKESRTQHGQDGDGKEGDDSQGSEQEQRVGSGADAGLGAGGGG
jgi:hypothetical protein